MVKRLNRAHGHLKSILAMLEEAGLHGDSHSSFQAVEKAIGSAKRTLVHDHEHCLESSVRAGGNNADETIREFKEITQYLSG